MRGTIVVFILIYISVEIHCFTSVKTEIKKINPNRIHTEQTVKPHKQNKTVSRHKESHFEYKTVTAYCSCERCCGKSVNDKAYGITASGKQVRVGMIAASYPFGTRIKILGKIYTVEDRLSDRYSDRIDIFINSHQECLNFGIQIIKVEVFD